MYKVEYRKYYEKTLKCSEFYGYDSAKVYCDYLVATGYLCYLINPKKG